MTRSITSATNAEIDAPVTRPGYFIEILFSVPLHICTRGDKPWNGTQWAGLDVKVSGLGIDSSSSSQKGQLTFGNADLAMGALILNEGVVDRPVNIWKFYGDALADADAVQIFSGVGDGATIEPDKGTASINLTQYNARTVNCPRRFITPENGFSVTPPQGTVISWGGEQFTLQGSDN